MMNILTKVFQFKITTMKWYCISILQDVFLITLPKNDLRNAGDLRSSLCKNIIKIKWFHHLCLDYYRSWKHHPIPNASINLCYNKNLPILTCFARAWITSTLVWLNWWFALGQISRRRTDSQSAGVDSWDTFQSFVYSSPQVFPTIKTLSLLSISPTPSSTPSDACALHSHITSAIIRRWVWPRCLFFLAGPSKRWWWWWRLTTSRAGPATASLAAATVGRWGGSQGRSPGNSF